MVARGEEKCKEGPSRDGAKDIMVVPNPPQRGPSGFSFARSTDEYCTGKPAASLSIFC